MKTSMSTRLLGAILMAGASTIVYGAGGNPVQNPNFDTSLSGWTDPHNTSLWASNEDYQGSANSGAALVGVPALSESYLMQCVDVSGNTTYVLNGWAKSECGGDAELDLYWADEDCVAGMNFSSQIVPTSQQWAAMSIAAKAPNQRGTAIVVLRNNGVCHENVYFDSVSLLMDKVFSDDFDISMASQ
jgi:hypothetical protein